MPYKTVTISLEAYKALLREKRGKESFTDVILRLTSRKKRSLLEFFGKWAGDPGELDKVLTELDKLWKAWGRELLSDFGYECACSFACGDEGVKEKIRECEKLKMVIEDIRRGLSKLDF